MAVLFFGTSCNSNCVFCEQGRHDVTKDYAHLKKELEGLSGDMLRVTGGEPTISRHFLGLLHQARPRFREIRLETNGFMLSYRHFTEKLKDQVDYVQITFHTTDAVAYDKITRCRGSLERVNKAMGNMESAGIPFGANIVVTSHNCMHLSKSVKHLFSKGARTIILSSLNPNPRIRKPEVGSSAVQFSKSVPFIKQAISDSAYHKEIRIANFPLCVLGSIPNVHVHIDPVTGMQSEEKTYLPSCSACEKKNNCPGIWKEYLTMFWGGEFSPIITEDMLAKDYSFPTRFKGIYGFFAANLCDIIGLEHGFKKVSVFQPKPHERQKVLEFFSGYHIQPHGSELIVAREKEHLKEYASCMAKGDNKGMGRLLGYPECCVGYYAENMPSSGDAEEHLRLLALSQSSKVSYLLNNFISVIPRIISFCVCDYNCKSAIQFSQNIFDYLEKDGINTKMIKSSMKLPMLYISKHECVCFEKIRKDGLEFSYSRILKSNAAASLGSSGTLRIKDDTVLAGGLILKEARIIQFE